MEYVKDVLKRHNVFCEEQDLLNIKESLESTIVNMITIELGNQHVEKWIDKHIKILEDKGYLVYHSFQRVYIKVPQGSEFEARRFMREIEPMYKDSLKRIYNTFDDNVYVEWESENCSVPISIEVSYTFDTLPSGYIKDGCKWQEQKSQKILVCGLE